MTQAEADEMIANRKAMISQFRIRRNQFQELADKYQKMANLNAGCVKSLLQANQELRMHMKTTKRAAKSAASM
jgi:hypothetical protein